MFYSRFVHFDVVQYSAVCVSRDVDACRRYNYGFTAIRHRNVEKNICEGNTGIFVVVSLLGYLYCCICDLARQ